MSDAPMDKLPSFSFSRIEKIRHTERCCYTTLRTDEFNDCALSSSSAFIHKRDEEVTVVTI